MKAPMSPEGAEPAAGRRTVISTRAQRLLTGAVAAPLALVVVFLLPGPLVLLVAVVVFGGAAVEYVRLVRHWAPSAPLGIVPAASAAAAFGLYLLRTAPPPATGGAGGVLWLLLGAGVLVALSSLVVLLSAVRMPEGMIGIGLIHFGIAYFTLPMLSIYLLAVSDTWLLALLLFAVWVGDSFAYLFGSRFGRHKLAPVVSPNKTWEGATAGMVGSLAVAVAWCYLRHGDLDLALVAVTGAAAAAGQLGDLLESMIKRGVGVKDSSRLLPGHGGLFDRLDALIVAAPVFAVGLWLLGHDLHP